MENNFDIHNWQAEYKNKRVLKEGEEEIVNNLLDATDGPLNEFAVIVRALNMASTADYSINHLANALFNALDEIKAQGGEISSTEFR